MAILRVTKYGEDILRQKLKPVDFKTLEPLLPKLLKDMEDTCLAVRGVGLAANQIGLDYRLGDVPLSVNEEFHLLQIVREALTNVVRHARADHALIRLERAADGEVQLRVDDDGRGIAPGSGGDGHHGLSIMHERARQLGGRLNLGAAAGGRGTCVEMRFRPRVTHA